MLRNYLKIALRNTRKNITLSVINIAGLSIGLACCLLILLYITDELSFDQFHEHKQQLYQLTCVRSEQDGNNKKFAIAALVQGPAFKAGIPEITAYCRLNPKDIVVKKGNDVFDEHITWVDQNFFTLFTFPLLYGNPQTALVDPHAMVMSEESAVKYFGTADAVGKTLQMEVNGKFEPFTVTGIARNAPPNSSIQYHILLPFAYFETAYPDNGWMWVSFPTYLLLMPNADIRQVAFKMDAVYRSQAKDEIDLNSLAGYGNHFDWGLQPLSSMHLNTDYEGSPGVSDPIYSYILSGIALFILVIACINFVNLTIAQSLKRSKEIGMRKVMGSKRGQLTLQFLSESLMICLIAFVMAALLTLFLLPSFNALAGKSLSFYLFNWKLVGGTVLLLAATGFAAGFYPALVLSALRPIAALSGKAAGLGKNVLAKSLVVVQFSLATFLIIVTLFIYAQFNLLTETSVGYPDQNLLSFNVTKGIRSKPVMDLYRSRFSDLPGVINVGYKNVGHFGGKTQAGGKEFTATYEHINPSYLAALGATIVVGRNFSDAFPSDSTLSVLVNETLVKKAGWKDPVGKTIDYMNFPTWGNRRVTVIGVIKDYHTESLKESIQPLVFTQESSMPLGQMIVRIKPEHTASTLLTLEKAYHQLNPDHPFLYQFRDEENRRNYDAENKWKLIITFGAVITILISSVGLFGLTMLSAQKREKEIGIRKVLGASVTELAGMLSRDFARLVLIAFLIAIPAGGFVMHHWLQNFAYRVELTWWRFGLAGFIALIIAMMTISHQAIRAAVANPIKSLRNE